MKLRFTNKVSKIKPLNDPTRLPPKGPLPPPPPPISYSEMLKKAKEAEMENKVSDDIRVRIAQAFRNRLIK
jgi:hypothetical protein